MDSEIVDIARIAAPTLLSADPENTIRTRHRAADASPTVVVWEATTEIHFTEQPRPVSVRRELERRALPNAIDVGANDFYALKAASYDADTIVLAELTPQIEIAWVDDRMSWREREVILEAATHRDVRPYSRAHNLLARWLERRPPDRFFRISREVIQRMFRRLPAQLKANVRRSLLQECVAVARASGGFLGWRTVSTDEQNVIDSFAAELDPGDSVTEGCHFVAEEPTAR